VFDCLSCARLYLWPWTISYNISPCHLCEQWKEKEGQALVYLFVWKCMCVCCGFLSFSPLPKLLTPYTPRYGEWIMVLSIQPVNFLPDDVRQRWENDGKEKRERVSCTQRCVRERNKSERVEEEESPDVTACTRSSLWSSSFQMVNSFSQLILDRNLTFHDSVGRKRIFCSKSA
jgi:hypothetical protein